MARCLSVIFALCSYSFVVHAQGWRGILPLHSDCGDVQRVLGIKECANKTYDLGDSTVGIVFSQGTCAEGWRTRPGTVLTLDVHPKVRKPFLELKLDEKRFRKLNDPVVPGIVYFNNELKGLSIAVADDGCVLHYFYGPSRSDQTFKCEPLSGNTATAGELTVTKFDEYGFLSDFDEEQTRLNRFAFQLSSTPTLKGYIIVSRAVGLGQKEAMDRAGRGKGYLIKKGIVAERLFTSYDGCQRVSKIELFLAADNSTEPPASLVHPCPH